MRLPASLRGFLLQSLCWTALCFATESVCAALLHLGYPYNVPAVPSFARFGDFRFYVGKFRYFHSPDFYTQGPPLTYPPLMVAVMRLFVPAWTQNHGPAVLFSYELCILLTGASMLLLLRRALLRRHLVPSSAHLFLAILAVTAYPFWFDLYQGNVEWIVWITVTAGLFAFCQHRNRTAAVLFGVAGALKLFPLIFLALLLSRRRFFDIGLALLVTVTSTAVALWLVCPNIPLSFHQSRLALGALNFLYLLSLRPIESGFDHSLWCLIKRLFPTLPAPAILNHLWRWYAGIAVATGAALYLLRLRKLPELNQILCITVASVLLPPVSYDYTLLHLYPVLALLTFAALRAGDRPPKSLVYSLALLAFILSAQSEIIFNGHRVAASFKAVALTALLCVGLASPLTENLTQEKTADDLNHLPVELEINASAPQA